MCKTYILSSAYYACIVHVQQIFQIVRTLYVHLANVCTLRFFSLSTRWKQWARPLFYSCYRNGDRITTTNYRVYFESIRLYTYAKCTLLFSSPPFCQEAASILTSDWLRKTGEALTDLLSVPETMRLEAGRLPSSLCVFVCMCVSCLVLSLNRSQGLTQHGSLVPVIGQDISLSVKSFGVCGQF